MPPTPLPLAPARIRTLRILALAATLSVALPAAGAEDKAAPPTPAASAEAAAPSASGFRTKAASLPAKGLFEGEELSPAARAALDDLIVDMAGQQVDVALVVPVGPWRTDARGPDERRLTPARLAAVKRYLADRGVDSRRIYVESRLDPKLSEARLDVQIGARPLQD